MADMGMMQILAGIGINGICIAGIGEMVIGVVRMPRGLRVHAGQWIVVDKLSFHHACASTPWPRAAAAGRLRGSAPVLQAGVVVICNLSLFFFLLKVLSASFPAAAAVPFPFLVPTACAGEATGSIDCRGGESYCGHCARRGA